MKYGDEGLAGKNLKPSPHGWVGKPRNSLGSRGTCRSRGTPARAALSCIDPGNRRSRSIASSSNFIIRKHYSKWVEFRTEAQLKGREIHFVNLLARVAAQHSYHPSKCEHCKRNTGTERRRGNYRDKQ